MTYAQYYKRIDKKPTKKQLAQKAKAEKLMQKIKLKKESGDIEDRKQYKFINAVCPHCGVTNSDRPYPIIDVDYSGCSCCGESFEIEKSYSIEMRCKACERIIFYMEG